MPTAATAPKLTFRRANERGPANHGWLNSFHTFSFADYYDPAQMGFRSLRVINDDRVEAGAGFPTHGHQDMEIVSYVLEGALAHRDSMGTGSTLRPGDVQKMSAGSGVTHSEFNGSSTEAVHFLQIWIQPARRGLKPSYAQSHFAPEERRGRLRLVAAALPGDGAALPDRVLPLHQDARIYAGLLAPQERAVFEVAAGRGVWLHVAKGQVLVNGEALVAGDAVCTEQPGTLEVVGAPGTDLGEVLLFELA